MTRLLIVVIFFALAPFTYSSTAPKANCALVDFTAEETEFVEFNAAVKTPKSVKVLRSILGRYDPLTIRNVTLREFNYSTVVGRDVVVFSTINSLKVSGFENLILQYAHVISPNAFQVAISSKGPVSINATVAVTIPDWDSSVIVTLKVTLEKPFILTDIEADVIACAPNASPALCANLTVSDLWGKLENAFTKRHDSRIMKEVLTKLNNLSTKSVELDFESISEFEVHYDTSSFIDRTLLRLGTNFSVDKINRKGYSYNKFIRKVNRTAPTILNILINSIMEPWFNAKC